MFRYQKKKTTFGIQLSPKRSIRLKFNRQHGPSFFCDRIYGTSRRYNDKFKYLLSCFVSFTSWMLISLVTKPRDKSLVEATSNRHSWSFPHWSSAFCLKLSLCHVMLSANIGSKSGSEKLATLSLSPYVNKDWDWLICPEKNSVEDL